MIVCYYCESEKVVAQIRICVKTEKILWVLRVYANVFVCKNHILGEK